MPVGLSFRIMIWLGVAAVLLWSLGPIYWNLVSSITPSDDFAARPIHFFPQDFTLDHFERLMGINVDRIGGVQVWSQFRAAFGDFIAGSYLAHAVYGYFNNGGGSCYVVRIGGQGTSSAAQAVLASRAGTSMDTIRVNALEAGSAGNDVQIEITDAGGEGEEVQELL